MTPEQIKQLEKLAKVFNTSNVISPEDVKQVVEGIAQVLKVEREKIKGLSEEHKQTLENTINIVSKELDKVLSKVENTSQNAISEATEAVKKISDKLDEVKRLANEVMEMKPKDGEDGMDADEEKIIEEVLSKIRLPENKEIVLDNGAEIINKINDEKVAKINASRIEGLPTFEGKVNGGGWRNLSQLHDVNITDPTNNQILKYNSTTNVWENGTGGGGAFIDLTDVPSSYSGQGGKVVAVNVGENGLEFISASGVGTVTSVAATVPTGLTISGSPVTTTGTLAIGLDTGYVIPLQSTLDAKLDGTLTATRVPFASDVNTLTDDAHFYYNSTTDILHVHGLAGDATDGLLIESDNGTDIGILGAANTANVSWYGSHNFGGALIQPTTNDGTALGSSSNSWSDLFLASGGVINFNNGDVTLTHSANLLTLTGGDLALGANNLNLTGSIASTGSRVTKVWATDIESTNIPTVGGTAILTSLTAPQFTTIEIGHATDTTLSRVSAGVVAIEGVNIVTTSSTDTLTNKTLTAPKFADLGFIADANGNEMLIFDTVASAVNEITLANAATGNSPTITASGTDSNISINLQSKGTGVINILGNSTQGGEIRLFEDTDNGTNYTGFKSPASLAGNVVYTLPSADGSANQFLQTNGSGTLSWATPSGGGSFIGVRTTKSSVQSIGTTLTAVTFDTDTFDTDTMHDTSTNNTRITFTTAGYYLVTGVLNTDANAVTWGGIRLNGSTYIHKNGAGNAGASTSNGCGFNFIYEFSAADYIEMMGAFGTTQNSKSGVDGPFFSANKIG